MANAPEFDTAAAHKFFSARCFSMAWDLIEKKDRTPQEDEQMIMLNQASIWHWTQRQDATMQNMSIGFWQAARIYSILGRVENARHYAQLCLDYSKNEAPFFLAYAFEALARAEMVAGSKDKMREHLDKATELAADVSDKESRKLLLDDLATIK